MLVASAGRSHVAEADREDLEERVARLEELATATRR
jgi:hypothetical protein